MVSYAVGAKVLGKRSKEPLPSVFPIRCMESKAEIRFTSCRIPMPSVWRTHETYKRIYNERMSDLTALCSKCHEAAYTRPPKAERKNRPRKGTGPENLNNVDFIENASGKKG